MVIANFKNDSHPIVYGASQWNYGEVLRIQGLNLPKAVEIHFSLEKTAGQAIPRIGTTKDGVTDVVIPDSLLENEGELQDYFVYVWIYLTDATSGRTEHSLSIKVKARSKPEIPGGDDNADPFREAIEEVNNAADRAEIAEKQAGEYAEQTKADAIKTGEDRTAIAEMVESVSGIGEQVQAVKEYKDQAQTAATNALLSEQKSERAKELTLRAQAGAETAEGKAEQHALETAGDKTEVERLATQVRQDKSSVEQTVQGFGNTAQQAIQSVQSAGTQAVGEVNTTKSDAVKAVQTEGAKQTEAVQAKGQEVINSIPEDFTTQMQSKLDKQQGVEHAGKSLVIGDDGNVVPGEPTQQIEVDKTLTQEGQAADAKATGDKILQYAIKNTTSGECILRITDSADEKLQDFKLFGKSEQLSTTGKNLFDISKFPFEHDAEMIVIKPSEGQTSTDKGINITEDIKFEENTQYVISYDSYNVTQANENWTTIFTFYYTDGAYRDLYVNHFYGNLKKYFNSDSGKTIRNVAVRNPWKVGIEISKVQIEKGNVATDYEPYTGGKPSPSIEYQQEMVNAGESGQIEVQVTGKNLLEGLEFGSIDNQGNIIQSTTAYVNINKFIEVKEGKHVINSRDGKRFLCAIFLYDKDKQFIRLDQSGDCVVRKGEKYINITSAKSLVDGVDKTQIELTDRSINPTAYEPYKGLQKVQFQLDRPLTKWDRLEKREGVWGIARQSVREELTQYNFDTYILPSGSYPTGVYCYATKKSNAVLENQSSFCTHFKNSNYAYSITNAKVGIYSDHGKVQYKYFVSDKPTVDEFKAWLVQQKEAGTPVELVYKTAEETWEPLPEEMQSVLNALHTNYPTTIISNSEDTEMQLTYVADTKNYTDRKIEEAVTAQVQNLANLLSLMPLSTQAAMIEADTNNILENVEVTK